MAVYVWTDMRILYAKYPQRSHRMPSRPDLECIFVRVASVIKHRYIIIDELCVQPYGFKVYVEVRTAKKVFRGVVSGIAAKIVKLEWNKILGEVLHAVKDDQFVHAQIHVITNAYVNPLSAPEPGDVGGIDVVVAVKEGGVAEPIAHWDVQLVEGIRSVRNPRPPKRALVTGAPAHPLLSYIKTAVIPFQSKIGFAEKEVVA